MSLGEHRLYMGNNTYVDVQGIGDFKISSNNSTIILKYVLFAPTIRKNMISMSLLEEKDFEIRFKFGFATIGKEGIVMLRGKRIDDMYSIGSTINKISSFDYVYLFDFMIILFSCIYD